MRLLTVIIPARNEEGGVREVVLDASSVLDSAGLEYRLILVDDGSTDSTGELLDELNRALPDRVVVIHHARPLGLGQAYKSALERCDSELVTWLPADGEIAPDSLLGLAIDKLEVLREGTVIVPYPVGSLGTRSLGRLLLSLFFQRALNLFFMNRIRYFNGNAIYPTRFVRGVRVGSNGYFFNAELLIQVLRRFRPPIIQAPFRLRPRISGASKALRIANVSEVISSFIRLRFSA